jgi:hypothetical protein
MPLIQDTLDLLNSFIQFRGARSPDVAPTGMARLWYDKTTNKLKLSKSGAAFADLEAIPTAKLDDDAVTTDKLDPTTIQYAAVAVTNAQLKALRAAPKTLVAAPGAGFALEFVSALLLLDYGTNVLTEEDDNLAVRYTDGSGVIVSQAIEATGFIDQSADTLTNALSKVDVIAAKSGSENKALVLHNTGAEEFGGNAAADTVLRVKVLYRIHQTSW